MRHSIFRSRFEKLTPCSLDRGQRVRNSTFWISVSSTDRGPIKYQSGVEMGQYHERNGRYRKGHVLSLFLCSFMLSKRNFRSVIEDWGTARRDYLPVITSQIRSCTKFKFKSKHRVSFERRRITHSPTIDYSLVMEAMVS